MSDSEYIDLYFKNDSLEKIKSNARWARLPKDIFIGSSMRIVHARYGKPSLISVIKGQLIGVK
ncbi:MAG: hypothetical protein ABIL07_05195 [candidate division WOR-3 bacterium]